MRDVIDDTERSVLTIDLSCFWFSYNLCWLVHRKMVNVTGRNPFLFASKIPPPVQFLEPSPGYSDESSDDDSLLEDRQEEEEPQVAVLHVKMLPVHKVGVPSTSKPPIPPKVEVQRGRQGKAKEPLVPPVRVPDTQPGPPVNPLRSLDRNLVSVQPEYKRGVVLRRVPLDSESVHAYQRRPIQGLRRLRYRGPCQDVGGRQYASLTRHSASSAAVLPVYHL